MSSSARSRSPLREPTFFILLALTLGPRHGYAILRKVRSLSEGRVRLSTGTLYGVISRLLEEGWIRRVDNPLPAGKGRGRKVYAITNRGLSALDAEIERLRALVNASFGSLPGGSSVAGSSLWSESTRVQEGPPRWFRTDLWLSSQPSSLLLWHCLPCLRSALWWLRSDVPRAQKGRRRGLASFCRRPYPVHGVG